MDSLWVLVDFQPKKLGWKSPYIGSVAASGQCISERLLSGDKAAAHQSKNLEQPFAEC